MATRQYVGRGSKRPPPAEDVPPGKSQRSRSKSVEETPSEPFPVGTAVFKNFPKHGYYWGEVVNFDAKTGYYTVVYPEDDDEEEFTHDNLATVVVPKPISKDLSLVLAPLVVAGGKDIHCLYKLNGITKPKRVSNQSEFFLFLTERYRMRLRRRRGDTTLSASPIFRNLHWCNVYREHDRGTRYFRKLVLGIQETDPTVRLRKVLFKSYVYRVINRIETFEETGFPEEDNLKTLKTFFMKGKKIHGDPKRSFSTAAHQAEGFSAINQGLYESVGRGRLSLGKKLFCDVVEDVVAAKSTKQCCQALVSLPLVSRFKSWQILCDLVESKCVRYSDDGYCMLGPGAKNGLDTIFGTKFSKHNSEGVESKALDYANRLVRNQEKEFQKLGIEFPYWRNQRLSIKEIEHGLCEYQKYCKARKPRGTMRRFKSQAFYDASEIPVCHEHCCTIELRCDTCNTSACHSCEDPKDETYWQCADCLTLEKQKPASVSS